MIYIAPISERRIRARSKRRLDACIPYAFTAHRL